MKDFKSLFIAAALLVLFLPPAVEAGGPVVLMGIDAEDGGVGGHGPILVYADVVDAILANVSNGGGGILVVGGGKGTVPDNVTDFWNELGLQVSQSVTFVNGASGIAAQSFSGFAMLAVVSGEGETPNGGLTDAENSALAARSSDIASFVNGGGGLLGLSQVGLADRYTYIRGTFDLLVDVEDTISQCDQIEPTSEGLNIGITDALDVCCWHEAYLGFPGFMDPLAFYESGEFCFLTGSAAAIGGRDITLPGCGDGVLDSDEECDDGNSIDGDGCSASCEVENNPPVCQDQVTTIWPPNHKFVDIRLPEVTDPDGDPVSVTVMSITQDEPVDERGDGRTCPDASGIGLNIASVRAERSGRGDGRVYHVTYRAEDGFGGECTGIGSVCVPHDQGAHVSCIDQGPLFDSTVCTSIRFRRSRPR